VFSFRFPHKKPFNIREISVEITAENIMTKDKENDTVNDQYKACGWQRP
jgi:hypothetical protein